ncbi:hypothetical protein EVAR_73532_1 [Eumeta japonica]|uniref:Uncharacterized protein n=1 Tax=Eumeta variegata TaxID=151549 RepID=A0A4C1TRE0_EUMVA|nr:hypothetical protein EVAR_73532_1 [Eumeta japonica]
MAQNDSEIPPQPLRPAPAPCSAQSSQNPVNNTKIVTFSVNLENEAPFAGPHNGNMFRTNVLQSNLKRAVDIPVLEAPPQTKTSNNVVASVAATAIPRPVVKKYPQQNIHHMDDNPKTSSSSSDSDVDQLQRANNTNPFLEILSNNTALKPNQTTTKEPATPMANPLLK